MKIDLFRLRRAWLLSLVLAIHACGSTSQDTGRIQATPDAKDLQASGASGAELACIDETLQSGDLGFPVELPDVSTPEDFIAGIEEGLSTEEQTTLKTLILQCVKPTLVRQLISNGVEDHELATCVVENSLRLKDLIESTALTTVYHRDATALYPWTVDRGSPPEYAQRLCGVVDRTDAPGTWIASTQELAPMLTPPDSTQEEAGCLASLIDRHLDGFSVVENSSTFPARFEALLEQIPTEDSSAYRSGFVECYRERIVRERSQEAGVPEEFVHCQLDFANSEEAKGTAFENSFTFAEEFDPNDPEDVRALNDLTVACHHLQGG